MELYEAFGHYSDRLQAANVLGDVHVEFARAETDEEKFMVTRAAMAKYRMLPSALPSGSCRFRDETVAGELRTKGNQYFKTGRYYAAIDRFTKSLRLTVPGSEGWAIALANRSAALFRLRCYRRCLKDVDRALAAQYPAPLAYKLYERAGRAERELGRGDRARRNYGECLERLDVAAIPDEKKRELRAAIADAAKTCEGLESPPPPPSDGAVCEQLCDDENETVDQLLLGGANEHVPALSKCLELKITENMGRGVYATCDIDPGDIVAIDEPFIIGPYVEATRNTAVCHYTKCSKMNIGVIPCQKCLLVVFCDEECCKKADEEHHIECSIICCVLYLPGPIQIYELVMKWFIRECSQMGLEKYCSMINSLSKKKIDPLTRGFDENGLYKSDNFLTAYTLDVSENKLSTDVVFFFNCICVEITQYFILSGFNIPICYLPTVGASLVHMLKILDFNCWKINNLYRPNVSLLNNSFYLPTKLAFYPSICLFNHSCDANVMNSGCVSYKRRVLKAVQPILKGDQLFISYGCSYKVSDKISRNQYCWDVFKGECFCRPCLENWPTERYFPNRLSLQNILNPDVARFSSLAMECDKFAEFKSTTNPEDYNKHLKFLYSFLKLLYFNVKRPFSLYEECVQMISRAHIRMDRGEAELISNFHHELL